MSKRKNRQWLLASRPVGMVEESNFRLNEAEVPALADGEVLIRNLYFAFEPAMRGWMIDEPSYLPPVGIGEVMRAATVGQVIESKRSDLAVGDFVQTFSGWQEYTVGAAGGLGAVQKLPDGVDITLPLGVLGTTGLTAYFGLLEVGEPKAGETVVVSGAAGATGSIAGQIAKLKGCRVIGIAGGREKCNWLTEGAGFDAVIDYKSEDISKRLRELCPDGVDVFFDNVGGETLEAVLTHIGQGARVVLCGGISGYNDLDPAPGPRNLMNLVTRRGRMQGFIVLDYLARFQEAQKQLHDWVASGKLVHREDVQEGFENAPKTFLRLFKGANVGKQLLKVAAPLP